jgi:hypothetical protein
MRISNTTPFACLCICVGLLTTPGCSRDRDLERHELEEISAHHDLDVRTFQEARAEFARKNPVPRRIELPGQGTIVLFECTLEGYPGREELWVRYMYVNTTGHSIDAARITIRASDPETRAEWTDSTELVNPMLFRLGPDSTFTTYAHLPLRGMQLHPKWEWSISAQGVVRG